VSCPGCCEGESCRTGSARSACGSGGFQCDTCGLASTCGDGRCSGECGSTCWGCCSGGVCRWASVDACGAEGSACVACDPRYADECSPLGECSCGGGLPCESTQRCIGGACLCDAGSCDGCCASSRCHSGLDEVDCGVAGLACSSCGPVDVCYFGACVGVCDDLSCPAGCCSGTECHPADVTHCGVAGAPCVACDSLGADGCASGLCTCGTGPACLPGQHCVGGACRCDSTCPGCCDGVQCRPRSVDFCGVDGGACAICDPDRADNCDSSGECRCGMGDQCGTHDSCRDGSCDD